MSNRMFGLTDGELRTVDWCIQHGYMLSMPTLDEESGQWYWEAERLSQEIEAAREGFLTVDTGLSIERGYDAVMVASMAKELCNKLFARSGLGPTVPDEFVAASIWFGNVGGNPGPLFFGPDRVDRDLAWTIASDEYDEYEDDLSIELFPAANRVHTWAGLDFAIRKIKECVQK